MAAAAAAAMLRSAARSHRLRQPLDAERCLLGTRFLSSSSSSSVPTERSPSPKRPLKSMEQKSQPYPQNIYKRLLVKVDKIAEGLDEHSRLLKELEAELREHNKNADAIQWTPWAASISACLLFFALYKYC